jgi:16S rRNA (adenine1518-N6/adenine1519-N6)-dimethyltransferase
VVRLVPRPAGAAGIVDRARFAAVVRAAFGQRRKTLRNALGSLMDYYAIEAAGLRPDARAEQVPVDGFVRLANLPATGLSPSG